MSSSRRLLPAGSRLAAAVACALAAGSLAVPLAGCRFDPDPRDDAGRRVFRVGYLTNLTHAPALYGLEAGVFQARLGPDVLVKGHGFNAGPSVIEALFAGELDVAYVGPSPAINAHQKARGRAVRLLAGATAGGAALVAAPSIEKPSDLAGKRVASPALGNTQDVAFRTWLHANGLETKERGGPVELMPVAPADILTLFQRGQLAAAWVPEPWTSRLILEAGAKVLVDERTLWEGGVFPTTVVIASTVALEKRPELVRAFLAGHVEVVAKLRSDPAGTREVVANRLATEVGKKLPPAVIERAFAELSFTTDPMEPQLRRMAAEGAALGFLSEPAIEGLVDPSWLPRPATAP